MSHILSVGDLTRALTDVLEAEFPFVWVRGQVTNLSRPASGHLYFTLSDADPPLPEVRYRRSQGRGRTGGAGAAGAVDPLTGEVLEDGRDPAAELADGQEVLAAGRITVYAPRGAYQLLAELVQPSGLGDLALAFEALKRRLAEAGLFDEARKRPLPKNPVRVALVTSPRGAAVQDFLRLAGARGVGAQIRIHPVLVQGEAAPAQIVAALEAIGREGWAQVVALVRGGGSLEDLWAFNAEEVARAMAACPAPVVTGVGHEPDVTIADYVADRRFSTPSAVAVGLWPLRTDLAQAVDALDTSLRRALGARLELAGAELAGLSRALGWLSPARRLERLEEARREAARRLLALGPRLTGDLERERLSALRRLLAVGRALPEKPGRELAATLRALLRAFGPAELDARRERLEALRARLDLAAKLRLDSARRDLQLAAGRLAALDPEAPLARGYGLVRLERTGRLLRDPAEALPGDRLDLRLAGGSLTAVAVGQKDAVVAGQKDAVAVGQKSAVAVGPKDAVVAGPKDAVASEQNNAVVAGQKDAVVAGPKDAVASEQNNAVAVGPKDAVVAGQKSAVASGADAAGAAPDFPERGAP